MTDSSDAMKLRQMLTDTPGAVPLGAMAYRRLRDAIITGEMKPRTLIRESELARKLAVSRTPVREALRRLEAEQLITAIPGRGYVVIEHDAQDLENVYSVRAVLEGLAARLAATHRSRADVAHMEDIVSAMRRAVTRDSREELGRLNAQFHAAVTEASRNGYLAAMLGEIADVFERYRPVALQQPGRPSDAHREHSAILAAVDARDPDRAEELARQHVAAALKNRSKSRRPAAAT